MINTKRVNIAIQCLATLFIPTGLFAFKRINKLRDGIYIYIISIGIALMGILYGTLDIKMILNISTVSIVFSYLLPIAFMNKYCKEHNKKITFQRTS